MNLERIFADVFSIPEQSVNDALEFRDISSWDSMSHMTLIVRVEEAFSVEFSGDEIAGFRSVKDVRRALKRREAT